MRGEGPKEEGKIECTWKDVRRFPRDGIAHHPPPSQGRVKERGWLGSGLLGKRRAA